MTDFVVSKEQANANKAQLLRSLSNTATQYGFALKHGTRWDTKNGKPFTFIEIGYEES